MKAAAISTLETSVVAYRSEKPARRRAVPSHRPPCGTGDPVGIVLHSVPTAVSGFSEFVLINISHPGQRRCMRRLASRSRVI